MSHFAWSLTSQFLTSDFGLGVLATLLFVFVIRPALQRAGRARQLILAANEAFNEVERWAAETGYKGDAKLYRFLKLLSDKIDGLTAAEVEQAKRLAAAWAANGKADVTTA